MNNKKKHNSAYNWFTSAQDSDAYVAGGGCIILCLSESSDDEEYVTSSSSEVRNVLQLQRSRAGPRSIVEV
jgi:hypothetical protein